MLHFINETFKKDYISNYNSVITSVTFFKIINVIKTEIILFEPL